MAWRLAHLLHLAFAAQHTAVSDSLGDKSTGKPNAYPSRSVLGGTQGIDCDRAAVRLHVEQTNA